MTLLRLNYRYLVYCGIIFVLLFVRLVFLPQSTWKSGDTVEFVSTIKESPYRYFNTSRNEYSQIVSIELSHQTVSFFAPAYPEIKVGDTVEIVGPIERYISDTLPESIFSTVLPESRWTITPTHMELIPVSESSDWSWRRSLGKFKHNIIDIYKANLRFREAAILAGLVFGEREFLDPDFYESLKKSGLVHIVVASGFNVMVVGGFTLVLLIRLVSRKQALIASFVVTWVYILIIGFHPPVVRAGLMASFVMLGVILGRPRTVTLIFIISIICMLLYKIEWLNSLSWQLSTAATGGLIWILPLLKQVLTGVNQMIEKRLGSLVVMRYIVLVIYEAFCTTVAAQIAVLPLSIYYFGSISIIAPLSNALLVGFVPFFTIGGMVISVLSVISVWLGEMLLWLLSPFLLIFVWSIVFFASFQFSLLEIEGMTTKYFVFVYYLLLFVGLLFIKHKVNKNED